MDQSIVLAKNYKMWKSSITLLIALFTWNAVLGGMGTLVLCLHNDGEMHVELAGETFHSNTEDCAETEKSVDVSDCVSCTDIVLEAVDLGPTRQNELASVQMPSPVVSDAHIFLARAVIPSKFCNEYGRFSRAPPQAESTVQWISRTIALRL